MRFSDRTAWDTRETDLEQLLRQARLHPDFLDLTLSNPTRAGLDYNPAAILAPLANPAALAYTPDPRGLLFARQAVSAYYAGHGATVPPEHLLLATSTSETYSWLFRLLADPGDEILIPQPGYPLFDFLAGLDNLHLRPYPLFHDHGWWIDFAALEAAITPRTRALLVVHPANPTGHATGEAERHRLEELCARHNLALIVDEVFLDYPLTAPLETFARSPHPCLTFVLSGLSKVAALPQMKLAWLAVCASDEALRTAALNRLEVIADTFLSPGAPAQHALPAWLATAPAIQQQILTRVRDNLSAVQASGLAHLPVEAAWTAILRLPAWVSSPGHESDHLAERILTQTRVAVHPGSFYALPGRSTLVISLLGPVDSTREALTRIAAWSARLRLEL